MDFKQYIKIYEDWPIKGISFKDITPLLANRRVFDEAIYQICLDIPPKIDYIVAIEARGFIFGGAIAHQLYKPLILIRKPGKIPSGNFISEDCHIEYDKRTFQLENNLERNSKCWVIDDVLATGGCLNTAFSLIKRATGIPMGASFLIELTYCNGRQLFKHYPIHSLIKY